MKRWQRRRNLIVGLAASVSVVGLAACGGSDSGGATGSTEEHATDSTTPWVLGTTDSITSLDTAGSYDQGSWTLSYNLYQTLLTIPAGENTPAGDAAKSCEYTDPQTFTCTLQEGLTFSNGDELTSSDVKFSIDRNIKIADPNGASGLLASVDTVDAPDPQTVVFNLSRPDTTFQFVLTTPPAAILDEEVFPADKLLADEEIIGSGPYALDAFDKGEQATLKANESYQGPNAPRASQVLVSYFTESTQLKLAVQSGDVDVAWRSLSPLDLTSLKEGGQVDVVEGEGSEIRYWVWQLENEVPQDIAVRQAAAQLIDREQIASEVYDGTVDPLYSIVPPGFPGQADTFKDKYGAPDTDKATQILADAGVSTPVSITLGYTPSHYGPDSVNEATLVQEQLEASGLFTVDLQSAEWEQYQDLYKEGAYDLFMLGWFPDFLDADNYLSPFLVDGGFFANGYSNEEVNTLVEQEQGSSDPAERADVFGQLQTIAAEDVPFIPSWVGKNTAVGGPDIRGLADTLDPSFIMRFWLITKG